MASLSRDIVIAAFVAVTSGVLFALLYGWFIRRRPGSPADPVSAAVEAELGLWAHVWRGIGFGLLLGGITFIQRLMETGGLAPGAGWGLIVLLVLVGLADVPFIRAYRACLGRALRDARPPAP